MNIRLEQPADFKEVENLTREAFSCFRHALPKSRLTQSSTR